MNGDYVTIAVALWLFPELTYAQIHKWTQRGLASCTVKGARLVHIDEVARRATRASSAVA